MSLEQCPKCREYLIRSPHHLCPPAYECWIVGEEDTTDRVYSRVGPDLAAEDYLKRRCERDCERFGDDDSELVAVRDGSETKVYRVHMSLRWHFSADEAA